MTATADYYEVLGVPRDADAEKIKSAFRRLARRYHPDVSTEPDAEARFKEVAEAYGVLSDPARRASYDEQGSTGVAGATAEDLWSGIDFADIFGSGASAYGSLFDRLFRPTAPRPRPAEDVRLDLTISLADVATGADRVVTIRRPMLCPQCAGRGAVLSMTPRRCPRCGGTGQCTVSGLRGPLLVRQVTTCPECAGHGRVTDQPCPVCGASGRTMRDETVTIRVPPGVPEGATLRLDRQEMTGPTTAGPIGDAYVTIRTRTDARFSRDGADLWHDLHLQTSDAALGVTTTVPLPHGQVRVRVPPGTQPGSVLRVAGKGLPQYGSDGRGDLQLKVFVDIPWRVSPRQRELYEQLRAPDADTAADTDQVSDAAQVGRPTADTPDGQHGPSRRLLVAAIILLVLAVVDLVVGVVAISSAALITGANDGAGLRTMGWIMVVLGIVQLVGAAAVWAVSRSRRTR